jgi:hypothetical protein
VRQRAGLVDEPPEVAQAPGDRQNEESPDRARNRWSGPYLETPMRSSVRSTTGIRSTVQPSACSAGNWSGRIRRTPTTIRSSRGAAGGDGGFVLPAWTWLDFLLFLAAIPAGVGGCPLGVRGADAINRRLGRDAPGEDGERLPSRRDE